jgi:CheY-like chemotaxis protein
LGLSIVKRLAELLDITLKLQSHLEQGTVIRMSLAAARSKPQREVAQRVPPSIAGWTFLVIDDEAIIRDSMKCLLSELGAVVHLANGSSSAIAAARQFRLDVVISDYRLGGSDHGLRALQAVRPLQPSAKLILVTGDTTAEPLRAARSARITLMHKPVTAHELLLEVQKLTDR